MFQKISEEKLSTKKPQDKSLPKDLWREISTKENRKKVLPKDLRWTILCQKNVQRNLCNLYVTKLRRYLYLKICEKKAPPKNVWKDISTQTSQPTNWEEKSLAKNLSRKKSSKSLKKSTDKKLPEISPPKFLKRNFHHKKNWRTIFRQKIFEGKIYTNNWRGLSTKKICPSKRPTPKKTI